MLLVLRLDNGGNSKIEKLIQNPKRTHRISNHSPIIGCKKAVGVKFKAPKSECRAPENVHLQQQPKLVP